MGEGSSDFEISEVPSVSEMLCISPLEVDRPSRLQTLFRQALGGPTFVLAVAPVLNEGIEFTMTPGHWIGVGVVAVVSGVVWYFTRDLE